MTFNMKKLFSLGELYVSDFIKQDEEARAGKHDLTLIIDERYGAARLESVHLYIPCLGSIGTVVV